MSDTVKAWIEERRQAHAFSTTGPWVQDEDEGILGLDVYTDAGSESAPGRRERQAADIRTEDADDAHFIVDAHNMFPRALNALAKVLEEHKPRPNSSSALYPTPACTCGKNYPCPTVQAVQTAIEGAIND